MEAPAVTVSNIFTQAGETLNGLMGMTGDFFSGLWSNPLGKIILTLGLAGTAIGLCKSLFLRKKRVA